jgi:hypothetical protein
MITTQIASATADTNTTHKGDTRMTTYKQPEIWDYLEKENTTASATQALFEWGLNCDADANPFWLFVDLIGWSEEHYGHKIRESYALFGCVELDYLADALREYANRPHDVSNWITELMNCEEI